MGPQSIFHKVCPFVQGQSYLNIVPKISGYQVLATINAVVRSSASVASGIGDRPSRNGPRFHVKYKKDMMQNCLIMFFLFIGFVIPLRYDTR